MKVWKPNHKKRKGKTQIAVLSDYDEDVSLPKKRGKDEQPVIAPKRHRCHPHKCEEDVHPRGFNISVVPEALLPLHSTWKEPLQ